MNIISTFLFSAKHEHNCLWTKLSCESEGVNEWILIESPYTFRGEQKGVCALELLRNDKRFEPFLDRIYVITIEDNLFEKYKLTHCERDYFVVERESRAACLPYLNTKYKNNNDTKVLVGDVDELIDFSNDERRYEFYKVCREYDGPWQAKQLKYWWDYNNLSLYPKYMPIHTLGSLNSGTSSFAPRNDHCKTIETDELLAFEYAYSFSLEGNYHKLMSFSHDRYNKECIEEAWLGNTWHKTAARNERLGDQVWDFFETIELNESNAPKFVLENFDRLRTGTVNPNYADYRMQRYGVNPHPALQYGLLGQFKIKKQCNYYKK